MEVKGHEPCSSAANLVTAMIIEQGLSLKFICSHIGGTRRNAWNSNSNAKVGAKRDSTARAAWLMIAKNYRQPADEK